MYGEETIFLLLPFFFSQHLQPEKQIHQKILKFEEPCEYLHPHEKYKAARKSKLTAAAVLSRPISHLTSQDIHVMKARHELVL